MMTEVPGSGDAASGAPTDSLSAALAALWRIPHPGPDNLFATRDFKAVAAACGRTSTTIGFSSALHNILRSVGAPFALPPDHAHLVGTTEQAATAITHAFKQTSTLRRHLCPLDLADSLPPLRFGPGRVVDLTAEELGALLDAPRLARFYPGHALDLRRLAQFTWLVVEETVPVDPRPEARALPFMFENWNRDFGAIDPHQGHFARPVADALFFLLTGAWEDWADHAEINWRGFQVPWVYTFDDDLSVRPQAPPDPDSLSWEPWIIDDEFEGQIELERPSILSLHEVAAEELSRLDASRWQSVLKARRMPLFSTPVAHFLVQAFHVDGIDELLAHISTIEAALGLQADFMVRKTDPFPTVRGTKRVERRLTALLDDTQAAGQFNVLFDLRSKFVHGRAGLGLITSQQRIMARKLARRTSAALVERALQDQRPREQILADLLADGMAMQATS
ncbi:hypothetical protein [Citromicrobium sp. WPS32]|uniref:hypothetical protein n=1 Tax=Citromicrobium sp. WPS32 TaxID=1634517 RepID=UPI000ACA6AA2|nr:hypothetical protein [Citromicrobium sp. WPS32]|tara:strand:+ start:5548 stop:6900 length:1353 start_codon:yes stop_codon:yes gene_type:complete